MRPSTTSALVSGATIAAVVAASAWWFGAILPLAVPAGVFCGIAVATSFWGVPRLQWDHDVEPTAGTREFALVSAASAIPILAIVPVIALDALSLADRGALVALLLGVGFTGYGGAMTLLVWSHRRTGGQLRFETGPVAE